MAFTIIDRTAGSNIGNLTSGGGLAAAFDGTTNQAASACASLISVTSGYVGKTLAASKRFGKAIIYGANNAGFTSQEPPATPSVTINIRGKVGSAPASATDGTVIGTATFTDTGDESAGRTITSTNGVTYYDHIFAEVTVGVTSAIRVAELELYEFTPVGVSVIVIG